MKTRKIILLSAIGVLALTHALQLALAGPTGAKTLSLKDGPDSVTIRKTGADAATAAVLLKKADAAWTVGERSYRADSAAVDSLVDSVANLKVLGSVSGGSNPGDEDRYGLADGTALAVTLSKGGKELRTVRVGKASPTGQQTYVTVDGKKEVLLVSGNLAENFGKSEGELRDRDIYSQASDSLLGLTVSGAGNFSLTRAGSPPVWSVAPGASGTAAAAELDQDKTAAWVSSLANLRASKFLDDATPLPVSPLASVSLDFGPKKATVSIYEKQADGEYLCASSETPSPFTLPGYIAEKYLKKLSDISN